MASATAQVIDFASYRASRKPAAVASVQSLPLVPVMFVPVYFVPMIMVPGVA